ncbi:acidic leucine-rich nuclear phosphoprotein 32 family member B-like [Neltuma alba]|uniref:acidic leucine-rich nuclear phosphoprotein 32 family member B-like n=1 Tax=Neltuma alba TaxID=207710 RepID=UPI0010A3BE1B|nr:acidic leucine-rich nuclear phosphoprotein 32 family member B-like [Prosopis alba]
MENMGKAKKLINRSKLSHYLLFVSLISLCCLLLSSSSSSSSSSLLHYFNLYLSSLPSQILSHTIDKNCMFLLCNGLLVFVSITRSLSKSDPGDHDRRDDDDDEPLERSSSIEDTSEQVEAKELNVQVRATKIDAEMEEEEEDEEESKESEVLDLAMKKEEEEEEEEWRENEEILVEENVEEEDWGLSTEQMNKKFEDFIGRMREDLRIEAKRQIVMAYN